MSRRVIEDCAHALRAAGETERANALLNVSVVEIFDEGGPAFPTIENAVDPRSCGFSGYGGMSLRDWFAGQALSAVPDGDIVGARADKIADRLYEIANAIILRRARK